MQTIKITFTGRPAGFPKDGYMRCGHRWTLAAQSIAEDAFTDEQWELIAADPYLKLTDGGEEAGDPGSENAPDEIEVMEAIAQAILTLDADEFTDKGAAKVGSVREALGDDFAHAITAKQVTAVQKAMFDEGWSVPVKDAG